MSKKEIVIDRIKQQMNDISKEATANGMTPEILASILNFTPASSKTKPDCLLVESGLVNTFKTSATEVG